MGREATAQCRWANETGLCKILLEPPYLILRGELRRRAPIADLKDISVANDDLLFRVGSDEISIALGAVLAQKWLKALTTPPPTLAKKLGISDASTVMVIGEFESNELEEAISEAKSVSNNDACLAITSVTNAHELSLAVNQLQKLKMAIPPFWIIYPKGQTNGFGESSVRDILRERGFIDTKVASVSSELTALRFVLRTK